MTEAKKYKLDPARVSEATKLASEIARSFKGAAEKALYRAMPRVGQPESRENLSIDGERKSIGLVGSEKDGRQICLIKSSNVPGSRPKMRFPPLPLDVDYRSKFY